MDLSIETTEFVVPPYIQAHLDELKELTGGQAWVLNEVSGQNHHAFVISLSPDSMNPSSDTIINTDLDGTINLINDDTKLKFRMAALNLFQPDIKSKIAEDLLLIHQAAKTNGKYSPALELMYISKLLKNPNMDIKSIINSDTTDLPTYSKLNHPIYEIDQSLLSIFNKIFIENSFDDISLKMSELPENVFWAICTFGEPDYQMVKILAYMKLLKENHKRFPDQLILIDKGMKADVLKKIWTNQPQAENTLIDNNVKEIAAAQNNGLRVIYVKDRAMVDH